MERVELAEQLGLPAQVVTDSLLQQIAEDDTMLDHLDVCKRDPDMLRLLLGDGDDERSIPSTPALVAKASVALSRWAASGFQRVPVEEHRRRVGICGGCDHLTTPGKTNLMYRLLGTSQQSPSVCGKCGCDVRRKAWLATETCPMGRW